MTSSGLFISFEGIDGAGKSTHIDALAQVFRAQGRAVTLSREPGGTALAEKLRVLVLNDAMDSMTEALLVFAARRDHLRQLIEPALARWKVHTAADLWRPRLTNSDISEVSFRLAAEGLAALDDAASLEPLRERVAESSADFGMRMSAAKAVALLDPDQAFAAAGQKVDGGVQDRLLAIALLDNTKA